MVIESERAVQKSTRRLLRNIRQYLPGPRLTGGSDTIASPDQLSYG